ncbi:hypothetical protein [Devosia aurantiaca]|uniref:Glycosyltransferase RgtA/B/C/D-like domain-containing protein n=1 Tax=Devosia aurantiaca TaxID=2714858 RepID=A0A6M1SJY2_9HYPH|nr:hypothetical protein [Devosia aurantiaca]NGP17114.1 hypothetical protein [Devosia aurantiaca]
MMGWLERKWVQIGLIWLVLVAALSIAAVRLGNAPRVTGDDAMRLVGAIDLFNGQSWFDTMQHRDNTPFGAPMHWSRLIDAPLVALMALFTPLVGASAPLWAAFVWPLLVLLAVVVLVAAVTERVAGEGARLPALALLAMCLAVYTEFIPGRVDHHNVQIALTLLMMLTSIEGRADPKWAVVAAAAAATGLAIGTEALVSVITVLICFALYWVVDPQRSRAAVLAFAASFAMAVLLLLLTTTDPNAWLVPACDALSATYGVAAVGYAAAILIAVSLTAWLKHPALRLAVLAVLGSGVLLGLLSMFPACRAGPYGDLDADLAVILLSTIGEAQPIWDWNAQMRSELSLILTPTLGLLAVFLATVLAPKQQRWRWLVLSGFSFALFLVFCLQIRGFRLLTVAVIPGAAWIIAEAWAWFRARQTIATAAVAGFTLMAFSGAAHVSVLGLLSPPAGPPAQSSLSWTACLEPQAYEPLAALPPGRVMSYLLIGPSLLLQTPHQVVSAGYHRNEQGLRDMVRFYRDGEAEAQAVVHERGLDYLVFCRGIPATDGLAGLPDFNEPTWPWLTRISDPEAPLQIYAIDLSRSS